MTKFEVQYCSKRSSYLVVNRLSRDYFEQLAVCSNEDTANKIKNALHYYCNVSTEEIV